MRTDRSRPLLGALIAAVILSPVLAEPPSPPTAEAMARWSAAPMVVAGTLENVTAGPIGKSNPPVWTHRLTVKVDEVLRGDARAGETITLIHIARQDAEPTFSQGKRVLAAVNPGREGNVLMRIDEAAEATVAEARHVCALPVGWSVIGDGQLRSPWASLGDRAWPKDLPDPVGLMRCGATGRPAYLLGPGVAMTVDHVPPAKEVQWTNPDGDGQYKITVTNTTDAAIELPALRRVGENILWDECIAIICQGKVYTVPGAVGIAAATDPVKLEPGQSVSHVVNVLAMEGPEWPRGGYRIEFTFAIGERAVTKSLYYMSRHHDKLREELKATQKRGA